MNTADELFALPWPLPSQPMTADEYQRDAIAGAHNDDTGYEVDAAGTFTDSKGSPLPVTAAHKE